MSRSDRPRARSRKKKADRPPNPTPGRPTLCWSYGGGVQSAAIGVLIVEGVLPRPDIACIADTGREKRTTWQYLTEHMQPYLDRIGLQIQIIPHSLATRDLYASDGRTLLPAYDGDDGRMATFCSGHWKRDVVERWLRLQGVEEAVSWIGFSIDEMDRVSAKDHRPWCKIEYPLIDRMINRTMCKGLIRGAGLPEPLKSRCFGCPHQSDKEWLEVKEDPVDWAKALALDNEIRASDPEGTGLYLYSGRVPLEMATFGSEPGVPARPCDSGYCWT